MSYYYTVPDLTEGYVSEDRRVSKPTCECGLHSVDTKASEEQHSNYCPVYERYMKRLENDKKIQEMYKVNSP
jgi:hypothetical protein